MKLKALIVPPTGDAKLVKTKGKDFEFGGDGYKAPSANQINTMRVGVGKVRFAIYSKGVPIAWTVSSHKVVPGSYTGKDVLSVDGKYLTNVVREALDDESETKTLLYIVIGVSVLSIIISGICAYLIYKVAQVVNVV